MPDEQTLKIIIYAMAALMVLVPLVAICTRIPQGKGIGWQFIRFTAIAIALPLLGILALVGKLGDGLLPILGYAFGKGGDKDA